MAEFASFQCISSLLNLSRTEILKFSLIFDQMDQTKNSDLSKGRHQRKKNVFFRALPESPKPPPPWPQFGQLGPFFSDVKNDVLARITERSKDDYDNDVSDNCDHNFGTFDDFGVKNDQKVSNNMILMSKYKGKHGGKKGSKNSGRGLPPSPFSGNAQKKTFFFSGGLP